MSNKVTRIYAQLEQQPTATALEKVRILEVLKIIDRKERLQLNKQLIYKKVTPIKG